MLIVPLQPVPAQTVAVTLAGQACGLAVRQRATGLYLDLSLNGVTLLAGVRCVDRVYLVRDSYLGFLGDLAFVDRSGASDPDHAGLGGRFPLYWFAPGEP